MTLASLVPYPVHEQHFTATLAPFFLPLTGAGLLLMANRRLRFLPPIAAVLAIVLAVYALGEQRADEERKEIWTFAAYNSVTKAITENSRPDATVLTFWPGYTYASGRQYYPGLENQFGLRISEKITATERMRFHIAGKERIFAAIKRQEPELVVIGAWMNEINQVMNNEETAYFNWLFSQQYVIAADLGNVLVMKRRGS
jgi:hypothetical protein